LKAKLEEIKGYDRDKINKSKKTIRKFILNPIGSISKDEKIHFKRGDPLGGT
jgi:hypothetical protein